MTAAGVVAMYLEAHPNTLFTQMKNAIVRNAVGNHNAAARLFFITFVERTIIFFAD